MRNLRIGTRLGVGFSAVLAIMIVVVIANNLLSEKNRRDLVSGLTGTHEKIILATKLKTLMLENGIAMRNVGLQAEVAEMQQEEAKAKAKAQEYAQTRAKLAATGLSDDEKKQLENLARIEETINKAFKEAIGHALAFNSEGAARVISSRIEPATKQAVLEIDKLIVMQNVAADALLSKVIRDADKAVYAFYIVCAVTVGIAALLVWGLRRSITIPLDYAVQIASKVAAGKLVSDIRTEGKDEISILLQALKEMNDGLLRIVSEVRARADTISAVSQGIADGNSNLSLRTQSQASSLQQTAAAMEELSTTVKKNADSLESANLLVGSTADFALEGKKIVGNVIQTMKEIQNSSRMIFDITGVIDSISFQTNILALNAAVEAARAGEEGRGFAVVASEVRQLAQRSASAAKEIKALIGDSVEKIQDGNNLVDDAGIAMDKIVGSVSNVATIFSEIKYAGQEQSIGIQEISRSVAQIDKMTQMNAEMVEQAAEAAQRMREQTTLLLESVSAFEFEDPVGSVVPERYIVLLEN